MGSDDPAGLFKEGIMKGKRILTREQKDIRNERLNIQRRNKKRICPQCGCRELDRYQQICSECCVINRQISIDIYMASKKGKASLKKYQDKKTHQKRYCECGIELEKFKRYCPECRERKAKENLKRNVKKYYEEHKEKNNPVNKIIG